MENFNELISAEEEEKPTFSPIRPKQNSSTVKTVSGGILSGTPINLVKSAYPAAARSVRANGAVSVLVTTDEKGKVISASAIFGRPLLLASAAQAARASKFSPTLPSDKPIKVTAVIVHNLIPK